MPQHLPLPAPLPLPWTAVAVLQCQADTFTQLMLSRTARRERRFFPMVGAAPSLARRKLVRRTSRRLRLEGPWRPGQVAASPSRVPEPGGLVGSKYRDQKPRNQAAPGRGGQRAALTTTALQSALQTMKRGHPYSNWLASATQFTTGGSFLRKSRGRPAFGALLVNPATNGQPNSTDSQPHEASLTTHEIGQRSTVPHIDMSSRDPLYRLRPTRKYKSRNYLETTPLGAWCVPQRWKTENCQANGSTGGNYLPLCVSEPWLFAFIPRESHVTTCHRCTRVHTPTCEALLCNAPARSPPARISRISKAKGGRPTAFCKVDPG